jgi:hypothetical protein
MPLSELAPVELKFVGDVFPNQHFEGFQMVDRLVRLIWLT